MLKYISLGLILAHVYGGYVWAAPTLAYLFVFFGAVFYWLCLSLITGLKYSKISTDFDLTEMATIRVVYIGTTVFLYMTGYYWAFWFTLPWTVIMTIADIVSVMVRYGWIEIHKSQPDPDSKDDE